MKREILRKTWEALDKWVTDSLEEAILTPDAKLLRECALDADTLAALAARFQRLVETKSEMQKFLESIGKDRAQQLVNMGVLPAT